MVLKNPVEDHWRSLRSSTPSRRPSLCLPESLKITSWDMVGLYRGQKGLSLDSKKSLKRFEKGFQSPGAEKESKMTIFQVFFFFSRVFGSFSTFQVFSSFLDPGAERPWEPLFGLFSEFSREKPF